MCYNFFIMLYIIANFSGFLTGLQNKAELERHGTSTISPTIFQKVYRKLHSFPPFTAPLQLPPPLLFYCVLSLFNFLIYMVKIIIE